MDQSSVDSEIEIAVSDASLVVATSPNALPHRSMSRLFAYSCCWLGVSAINASLGVLLVVERVKLMVDESNQGVAVGLIQSLSGLCAGLIYPLVGHLSDSTRSKWGRRSPFMFLGTVVTLVGFFWTALGGEMLLMAPFVIGVVTINMGLAIVSAPFTALIPDLVIPSQYGTASGFMGLMTMLGNAIGAGVLGLLLSSLEIWFGTSFVPLCIILSLLMVVTLFVTLMAANEIPFAPSFDHAHVSSPVLTNTAGGPGLLQRVRRFFLLLFTRFVAIVLTIWRELKGPFVSRDFFWVFWTKFIYICGVVSVSNFLVLWIKDVFPAPYILFNSIELSKPEAAVSMFLLPLLIGATFASLVAGVLSDRFGQKIMVYISGALQAGSAIAMMVFPQMDAVVPLGLIFGVGYGAFLSVDFALAAQTIPSGEKSAAKDLGVWHVANTLANVLTPFGAGALLDFFKHVGVTNKIGGGLQLGYTVIFSLATLFFVLSAALISRVSVGGRKTRASTEEVSMVEMLQTTTMDREVSINKEE